MKRLCGLLSLCALFALLALTDCESKPNAAPTPPDTRAADERAIRSLALDWAKAAAARDLEKTLSFYADGASVYPPNQPIATTKEQRRQVWEQSFAIPGFALSISITKVEVSRAGDIAYETGSFEVTANDKQGKPATSKGKYVVVWKKQANAAWKAVADIWNLDQ